MENDNTHISADTLRTWLDQNKPLFILDIRPQEERMEWKIPGSHYLNAYKRLNGVDASVMDEIEVPANMKVVTVCTAGRTSQLASQLLRRKGIDALSLEGGMKAWSLAWNKAKLSFQDYEIIQLRRTGKGCLSYILASQNEAIVIDASLSVEIYENVLQENGWRLIAVLETHMHADHLSRSRQLAQRNHADLILPVPNKAAFTYKAVRDSDILSLGRIKITTIASPGHTMESVSFLVNDEVLFTGDTLFTDGIGRPDLKADSSEAKKRAELLYESLQSLKHMDNDIIVLPAHTNEPVEFDGKPIMAILGEIKNKVPLLNLDKSRFIETILEKLPPTPANFLTIVEKNLKGDFSDINPIDLEAGANRCAIS